MSVKVYQIITDRIIQSLEKGTIPWRKPWSSSAAMNIISKKPYRGVNALLTNCSAFSSPYFGTFKQISAIGGLIRKGEKGTPIVFWNFNENEDTGKRSVWCKYYTVFNLDQCDEIHADLLPKIVRPNNPIDSCESVKTGFVEAPQFENNTSKAFYSPMHDTISLPVIGQFHSSEEFYSTLFHEMIHSTGHGKRLGRLGEDQSLNLGDHSYSKEELVAEIGASFLCSIAGIDSDKSMIENQEAYIKSWLKKLKDDSKFVIEAAQKAQKACDLILNRKIEKEIK